MAAPDPKLAEPKLAPPMAARLAKALLELREKHAGKLVAALIPRDALQRIGPDHALPPIAGKRWKAMSDLEHAIVAVRGMREPSKRQSDVLDAVTARFVAPLPGGDPESGAVDDELASRWLALTRTTDRQTRVRAMLALLLDSTRKEAVCAALDAEFLAEPETASDRDAAPTDPKDDIIRRLEARLARSEADRAQHDTAALERERALKLRLEQAQTEVGELQQRLGKSHREIVELRSLYETAKSDLELAFRRAARFKQTLDETKAASEREKELLEAYAREKQRADIEASKVEILEYELDVLGHDDEPSSPPPAPDAGRNAVIERIRRYESAHGAKPRILIVGGAGKQRSHRDRDFEAMKDRLGIDGEWRFADYGSWHRDLPRLRNDIQHRFDLVFVLHWNRTTFVQKMHDEARALNGRVRTVPYRGFLSLERAITEEVDRFVSERS